MSRALKGSRDITAMYGGSKDTPVRTQKLGGQKFDAQSMGNKRVGNNFGLTKDSNGAQQKVDVTGDKGDPTSNNRSWAKGSADMSVGKPPKMSIGGRSNPTANISKATKGEGGHSTSTKQQPWQNRVK